MLYRNMGLNFSYGIGDYTKKYRIFSKRGARSICSEIY